MEYIFKQSFNQDFFRLLPSDWQDSIVPYWDSYSDNSSVYLLYNKNELIAGGIIFHSCSPDMMYNEQEAKKWFDNGYLYIGFIWVIEEYRNKKIGSKWLKALIDKFPTQKFWLTVDEQNLAFFYTKNGFKLIKSLKNGDDIEWLLTYESA
ncbi:MAG: GNAT family N-acetyltransferase [Bacteroidetes bacterium]|nr:GNAT family N-acetyltransferase [Bacteroidota bacterium]